MHALGDPRSAKSKGTRSLSSLNPISDGPAFCFDDFRLDRRDGLFRRMRVGGNNRSRLDRARSMC